MTDSEALRLKISEEGLKLKFVAQQLGITRQGFRLKVNNTNEFTSGEIQKLCEILNISSLKEKERIFFTQHSD